MYISVIVMALALLIIMIPTSNVFATGIRGDSDEGATPEEVDCFVNGYDSGFAGKYDSERARECIEHDDQYNFTWAIGCKDSTRTEKECGELINNPVQIQDYAALYDKNSRVCYDAGAEDGKAGVPFNKERDDGCYEFDDISNGYEGGYQWGCETHTTPSSCELLYEDKSNYCPDNPDNVGCVEFLHNDTNKLTESTMSACSGAGDPRPNIICPQETNPEKYCLKWNSPVFCRTIGDICDDEGYVRPEYPYCQTN